MYTSLDQLNSCPDVGAVRSALHSLCARFGSIRRLDIIDSSRGGTRQAMCFLRMSSVEQETELAHELGVGRFGGDLVFVVDLNTSGPSGTVRLSTSGALNMPGINREAGASALI
jgi:hypothetical protein